MELLNMNKETFIKDNALWSLQVTNTTETREIDFEDDLWRHDD